MFFMFQVSAITFEPWTVDFLFRCFFGDTEQMKPDLVIWITYLLMTQLVQN